MIGKDRGEFYCKCDGCEETVLYGGCEDSFIAFVAEIKENGWSISKEGDTWIHLCPECA